MQVLYFSLSALYSSSTLNMLDADDISMSAVGDVVSISGQPFSRRTRLMKGENNFGAGSSLLSSVDGGYVHIYLKIYKTIVIPSEDCTP
jgi:hypothetical protein